MQTVIYLRPSKKVLEEHSEPELPVPADAVANATTATKTTISGAGLHLVKGGVSRLRRDRVLNNDDKVFVDRGQLAFNPF